MVLVSPCLSQGAQNGSAHALFNLGNLKRREIISEVGR
jgi:hypothetical protein